MKDIKDVCVVVQSRLNSQRCYYKMLRKFGETTLFDIACEKLEKLNLPPEQKYVSIYEDELVRVANKYDVAQYHRTKESANADEGLSLIWEWCKYIPYTYYVTFNACLPFLEVSTIQGFIDNFLKSDKEIMFGVKPLRDYIWTQGGNLMIPPRPPDSGIMNTKSQDLIDNQVYLAAHALYAGSMQDARNNTQLGTFNSDTLSLYVMEDSVELFDIDTETDFKIAENIL